MPSHLLLLAVLLIPPLSLAGPLFDAHLHYDAEHLGAMPPEAALARLDGSDVRHALVTGMPPRTVLELHRLAPQRIIPLLGVYRRPGDKRDWHADAGLPEWVERTLETGPWRGIGELHILAPHRHSPVLRRLAELAVAHDLPLLLHADPAVVDTLYETVPGLTLIWAHAGTYPYPRLIADYLARYPRLHVDLSVRDARIAPGGELDDAWYRLLVEHSERFLVGVDTFSLARWQAYDRVVAGIRHWLAQLPPETAERLARGNAERLLGVRGEE
ncbi:MULTISPECIES: amidohydrolase family protein [Thiohalobacter]|nr:MULTISPECIES: TatD family hydrolase [Thiohalobacter]